MHKIEPRSDEYIDLLLSLQGREVREVFMQGRRLIATQRHQFPCTPSGSSPPLRRGISIP